MIKEWITGMDCIVSMINNTENPDTIEKNRKDVMVRKDPLPNVEKREGV